LSAVIAVRRSRDGAVDDEEAAMMIVGEKRLISTLDYKSIISFFGTPFIYSTFGPVTDQDLARLSYLPADSQNFSWEEMIRTSILYGPLRSSTPV
jgi:hypothetical protein